MVWIKEANQQVYGRCFGGVSGIACTKFIWVFFFWWRVRLILEKQYYIPRYIFAMLRERYKVPLRIWIQFLSFWFRKNWQQLWFKGRIDTYIVTLYFFKVYYSFILFHVLDMFSKTSQVCVLSIHKLAVLFIWLSIKKWYDVIWSVSNYVPT